MLLSDLADRVALEHLRWAQAGGQTLAAVMRSIGGRPWPGMGEDDVLDALASAWLSQAVTADEREVSAPPRRRTDWGEMTPMPAPRLDVRAAEAARTQRESSPPQRVVPPTEVSELSPAERRLYVKLRRAGHGRASAMREAARAA